MRFQENGIKVKINFIGSIFNISMVKSLSRRPNKIVGGRDFALKSNLDEAAFKKFYHRLLKEGVYLAPSQFEVNFVSAAHTLKDIEKTEKAIEKVCSF